MIAQIPIMEKIGSDYDSHFMLHVHFVTSRAQLWCFDSRTGWKIDLPSRFTLPLGNTSKVSAVENWFQNQHLHPENVQTSPKFLPAEISSTARLDEANSCGPCSSWEYILFLSVPVAGRCRPVPGRTSEGAAGCRPVAGRAGCRPVPVAGRCRLGKLSN